MAFHRLQGRRANQVSRLEKTLSGHDDFNRVRLSKRGPVDQCQTLLLLELEGYESA